MSKLTMLTTLFELACGSTGATTHQAVRKNLGEPCTVKEIAVVSGLEPKRVAPAMKPLVKKGFVEASQAPGQDIGGKKVAFRITVEGLDHLNEKGAIPDLKANKKAADADPSPKADKPKKTTRKDRVRAMLKAGTTIEAITKELECSKQAAHSLLGDLRREKVEMTRERVDGVNQWTAA